MRRSHTLPVLPLETRRRFHSRSVEDAADRAGILPDPFEDCFQRRIIRNIAAMIGSRIFEIGGRAAAEYMHSQVKFFGHRSSDIRRDSSLSSGNKPGAASRNRNRAIAAMPDVEWRAQ